MIPKPWADQPLPMIETPALTRDKTHAAIHIATEMALVHNCLLRGLNSIYLQASHVTNPVDIKDFLFFCHVWGKSTDNHHDTEEQFIFPAVEAFAKQPGIMDKNREQHQAFHDGLEAFKTYSAETQPEDYNPVKLREILDTFVKPFQQHLKEEIDTLVALENLESTGLSKLWKAAEAKASGSVRKVSWWLSQTNSLSSIASPRALR
ncbi:MAG: hypothetical protein MMC33_001242 [Icmadophila ericetorum]|nr:hypothetical protein [Icmadophila ericetorum]